MSRKPTTIAGVSAAIVTALALTQPAHADKKTAEALIAGVALGVIGSSIAEHQHHNGDNNYHPHPSAGREENEIGQCMHRTHRAMQNRGYANTKFEYVVDFTSSAEQDRMVLRISANAVGAVGIVQRNVTCIFDNGEMTGYFIRNA